MKPQTDVRVVEAPTLSPERQLLWDAAQLIEEHGWCQGHYERAGAHCIYGAMTAISDRVEGEGFDILMAAQEIMRSKCDRSVAGWNDAPGRTQAEVVATMRAAALEG